MARILFRKSHGAQLGIACCFLWYLLLSQFYPSTIVDEKLHQNEILAIHQGNFEFSNLLPQAARSVDDQDFAGWGSRILYGPWAGYHWIMALSSSFLGPSLGLSRFLTFLISAAMIVIYASIPQQQSTPKVRRSPLLLALLPILFPYTALVYTDAVALFFIIGAIFLHTKRIYVLAAVSMFIACLVRQSNIIWVIFLVAWSALDTWELCEKGGVLARLPSLKTFVRNLLPQVFPYIMALGFVGAFLIISGDLLSSGVQENLPKPNIGNFYTLAFFALILWAPIWLERIKEDMRSVLLAMRMKPIRTGFLSLIPVAFGLVLIETFDNWHPWNWTPMALRNIPLILMDRYVPFRVIGVTCIFLAMWLVARFWESQSNRRHLILIAFFTFLFLLAHPVVEPRYLIVPFVLTNFFVDYSSAQLTKLAFWYILIDVVICSLIASGLAIW